MVVYTTITFTAGYVHRQTGAGCNAGGQQALDSTYLVGY